MDSMRILEAYLMLRTACLQILGKQLKPSAAFCFPGCKWSFVELLEAFALLISIS